MGTTPDGNTYFYVRVGDESLKFGVPTTMAQKIAESNRKSLNKSKISLSLVIENGEKAIAEAFQKGHHKKEKTSKNLAPLIMSCCLFSKEAIENPDARGFILEIRPGITTLDSSEANGILPDGAEPNMPKMFAQYKAVAGRDEIDAFVATTGAALPVQI